MHHAVVIGTNAEWAVVLLALAAVACFYLAFRYWGLARSVADTALARVRSAPHGYVELFGRAQCPADQPHKPAPLSGRSCVWWSYRIQCNKGGKRGWDTLESATSDAPFVLHDDSGECLVDPRGAEVTPTQRQVWYGSESWPSAPYSTSSGPYRYVEQRIHEYDGVSVLGELAAIGGMSGTNVEDEVAALLHSWKDDQTVLLKRFDSDHDGKLNAAEWEQARSAAHEEVVKRMAQTPLIKCIGKPRDGRAFLLAARDPAHLVRHYRWRAAAGFVGFFLSVLVLSRLLLHP